ncbi:MAG: type II toxin-antitoxin system RelE/ParE family toxin [Saprospiraceae bacterium]|nr:type II toxin-antitoxin system RelE/ParE family toxin [Saprospiraceae bacterium]HPG07117.1 type II toxin-antitoxin system RelE/ParE family toxin [Saprospiraceae bacterium]
MYRLIISGEAYDDLKDVLNFAYTEFGEGQWNNYKNILDNALRQLLNNPLIGRYREDLPQPYRALLAGLHVLIYRVQDETIYVIRILHQRMDFTYRFKGGTLNSLRNLQTPILVNKQ